MKRIIFTVTCALLGAAVFATEAPSAIATIRVGEVAEVRIADVLPAANGTFSVHVRFKDDPVVYWTDGSKELLPVLLKKRDRVQFTVIGKNELVKVERLATETQPDLDGMASDSRR